MEDRQAALDHISKALESAKSRILSALPGVSVNHQRAVSKLLVSGNGASIKVEVNQTIRGTLQKPKKLIICQKAQEAFPSVQWKLQNLKNLRQNNPEKHSEQLGRLKKLLSDA